MKFISVLWILIIIIKVAKTKNRNIRMTPKPPLVIYGVQESIGLFPKLPNKRTEFITDLNLPIKTYSKEYPTEMYEKSIMQEIPTKEINYKNNDEVISEVTTRRSLMPTKKFTVRLHDVFPQSGLKKYNWYSNRQRNKLPNNKNIYNSIIRENQYNPNSYVTPRSQKIKTTFLFQKRNNTKDLKNNPEENLSKRLQINNFDSDSRFPLDVGKKSDDIIIEKKQNITLTPNILNKTDSKDQIDVMDDADEVITTDSDIEYSVLRPKRSVNIIEEESVATTFSGIQITNQEYQSHDLTFKNIHT